MLLAFTLQVFFTSYLKNSALISATDGTARIFLPPYAAAWFQRVAPDRNIWRTLYRLSYSAAANFQATNFILQSSLYCDQSPKLFSWQFLISVFQVPNSWILRVIPDWGQRWQQSGRAHALGVNTRAVVGSNPAWCWAFFSFFFPFSHHITLAINQVPQGRCISAINEVNKKIFQAVLLGAKQALNAQNGI